MTTATPKQLDRVQKTWSEYAGEPVTVEIVSDVLYAFGSELACLRLFKRLGASGTVGYSKTLKTWFYRN